MSLQAQPTVALIHFPGTHLLLRHRMSLLCHVQLRLRSERLHPQILLSQPLTFLTAERAPGKGAFGRGEGTEG